MSSTVAGSFRQIHTRIWSDVWFQDLLPEEKLLFIYLFSNEHASICGLYELSLKTMGFETGLRPDAISLALHRFEQAGKAFYSAPYVWVPNLRKYNENPSPKVQARIAKELAGIPDCTLKRRYEAHHITPADVAATGGGSVPIPYPESGSEQEHEQEHQKEQGRSRRGARGFGGVVRTWEAAAGPISALTAEQLGALADEAESHRRTLPAESEGGQASGTDWVCEAIREAAMSSDGRGVRVKFVQAIVDRWMREGFKAPFRARGMAASRSEDELEAWMRDGQ